MRMEIGVRKMKKRMKIMMLSEMYVVKIMFHLENEWGEVNKFCTIVSHPSSTSFFFFFLAVIITFYTHNQFIYMLPDLRKGTTSHHFTDFFNFWQFS